MDIILTKSSSKTPCMTLKAGWKRLNGLRNDGWKGSDSDLLSS